MIEGVSNAQLEQVWELVRSFVNDHKLEDADSIHNNEAAFDELPAFINELAAVGGFYETPEARAHREFTERAVLRLAKSHIKIYRHERFNTAPVLPSREVFIVNAATELGVKVSAETIQKLAARMELD